MSEINRPWDILPGWVIAGMYNFEHNGNLRLFVAMRKGDLIICEQGEDDEFLWNRLWHKAQELDK
ncbi:hypothetical protein LCGC14_2123940 [marine sediment metagenome]|uniref:Uncharacterized protein n=1 Tax=marine sediment metagenome TaxID=412755 RepID=A0A0F9EQK3_9ZZZZ